MYTQGIVYKLLPIALVLAIVIIRLSYLSYAFSLFVITEMKIKQ